MDPALLQQALEQGNNIKAVIVAYLYGQCAEMKGSSQSVSNTISLCRRRPKHLVHATAEAQRVQWVHIPSSLLMATKSSLLLAVACYSNNCEGIKQARYLATQAREPVAHYEHKSVGYNYRMSNLLAGLGNSQLSDLRRRIHTRRAHYEAYHTELASLPGIEFMPIAEPDAANYWLTCLTVDSETSGSSRDELMAALEVADIEARPLWKPLHLQPVFKDKICHGGELAAGLFKNGLCLPSGSAMMNPTAMSD